MSVTFLALLTDDDRRLLAYNRRVHIFVPIYLGSNHFAWEYGGNFDHLPANYEELDARGEKYEKRSGPALMAVDWCGNVEGVGGAALVEVGATFTVKIPRAAPVKAVVERVETVCLPDKTWQWMYTLGWKS